MSPVVKINQRPFAHSLLFSPTQADDIVVYKKLNVGKRSKRMQNYLCKQNYDLGAAAEKKKS